MIEGRTGPGGDHARVLPPDLERRRCVNAATFWHAADAIGLKPADANQRARSYVPTASALAVVVVTPPDMASFEGGPPDAVSVPASLEEFVAGWALSPAQTTRLRDGG